MGAAIYGALEYHQMPFAHTNGANHRRSPHPQVRGAPTPLVRIGASR